jgi:dihydrofolate synthase/folylpolyglutamate synthase
MNYPDAIQYLYNSLPMFQRIGAAAFKKDLNNTLALCAHLNNPQQAFPSVHIAGTNGKGSSAHSIAAVLQAAGYKCGLYTSPHLKEFTERIRINGREISQQAVVDFVRNNQAFLEELKPSFFETTVAMAFDYFRNEEVDIAIIEVGMGGRLDSTNVIRPLVSLITHIGYDHMEFLGDTLDKIAAEKAGIIKEGIPVVIGERQSETEEVFVSTARAHKSAIYFAQDRFQAKINQSGVGKNTVDIAKHGQLIYPAMHLSLGGYYQLKNLPGVLMVLDLLSEQGFQVNEAHLRQGLSQVTHLTGLKGRWQQIQQHPLIICDTGHNQGAIREIVMQLKDVRYKKLYMVLGFSVEKDLSSVLPLLPKDAFYLYCSANIPRAMPAATLAANAREYDLQGEVLATVEAAYARAKELADENDCIFVGGSTFVVAEIDDL